MQTVDGRKLWKAFAAARHAAHNRRAEHRSEYVEEGGMNAMIEEAVRDEAVLRAALAEADIARC